MLNGLRDDLKLVFRLVISITIVSILGIFVTFGVWGIYNYFTYILDKSECIVKVDKQIIHTGGSALMFIDSIGVNGNTKHVIIYKDKFHLRPSAHYVSNDVEVR